MGLVEVVSRVDHLPAAIQVGGLVILGGLYAVYRDRTDRGEGSD